MKLIEPSVEIIKQLTSTKDLVCMDYIGWERDTLISGVYKQIELAGRTCYKSEDKITTNSAEDFVNRMIKSGHGAMLEHGTIYLQLIGTYLDPTDSDISYGNYLVNHYVNNKYSKVSIKHDDEWKSNIYITTNLRVLVENGWLDDLKYICEPTEYHEKRVTVKFTCDRGITAEFTRQRVFSFAQESTRYCNYSKDKFNNELTFIKPTWYSEDDNTLINALNTNEASYFKLLKEGKTAQQARQVLPLALKADLVMTGTIKDWKGFFKLRCDKAAHPDAQYLAKELLKQMYKEYPTELKEEYSLYIK